MYLSDMSLPSLMKVEMTSGNRTEIAFVGRKSQPNYTGKEEFLIIIALLVYDQTVKTSTFTRDLTLLYGKQFTSLNRVF